MPSRRYVAKYGAIRFLSCPGQAGTVSKFRGISGTVWKTRSPTPPRTAKVKLRNKSLLASLVRNWDSEFKHAGHFADQPQSGPVLGEFPEPWIGRSCEWFGHPL